VLYHAVGFLEGPGRVGVQLWKRIKTSRPFNELVVTPCTRKKSDTKTILFVDVAPGWGCRRMHAGRVGLTSAENFFNLFFVFMFASFSVLVFKKFDFLVALVKCFEISIRGY
jgi:hypothetical protein